MFGKTVVLILTDGDEAITVKIFVSGVPSMTYQQWQDAARKKLIRLIGV